MSSTTAWSEYALRYLGETIEVFETTNDESAREYRDAFVMDIMTDQIPDFLTADDFESFADCRSQIRCVRLAVLA